MSAAIAPHPATTRSAPTRRGHLRVVEEPARPALAPTGPLQAWRRRIGALAVLLAAVVLIGQAVAGGLAGDGSTAVDEAVPVSASTVVVQPGQTLWEVASQHAPAGIAPRAYLDQLRAANGIEGSAVDAWQVLRLPAAG